MAIVPVSLLAAVLLGGAVKPAASEQVSVLSKASSPARSTLSAGPGTAALAANPGPEPVSPPEMDLPEAALLARALPWETVDRNHAWAELMASPSEKRQNARWRMALAYLADGFAAEAFGMLDQMLRDDRGLLQVANFRLARGQALTQLGRHAEAVEILSHPLLEAQPDACAWRLRALMAYGKPQDALAHARCAVPALDRAPEPLRAPFLKAMARAGIEAGRPAFALDWLRHLPETDPEGRLLRAKALLASGKAREGNAILATVARNGGAALAAEAELFRIADGVRSGAMSDDVALAALDQLTFRWRGDRIEKQALFISNQISAKRNDVARLLSTGATLIRHYTIVLDDPEFVTRYRSQLAKLLEPSAEKALPIEAAAGFYWDYRDLAPVGAEGDLLASRLATRLEAIGLYAKAGELLEHQMLARVSDEAKGPLSVKVGTLFLRAGLPVRTLDALRRSARLMYPKQLLDQRKKIESVTLARLGKGEEALATLEGVDDVAGLEAEILWRMEDWPRLIAAQAPMINAARPNRPLDAALQVLVLRQSIALAMAADDAGLTALRARFASGFAGQPAQAAFRVLTVTQEAPDPDMLIKAMAAMPVISPAGELADLMGPPSKLPSAAPLQRSPGPKQIANGVGSPPAPPTPPGTTRLSPAKNQSPARPSTKVASL